MKKILLTLLSALALLAVPQARAWTYQDSDVLLIFRKSGYNDVEFDLGNVSQFLGKSDGYVSPVSGWDASLVTSTFGSNLNGVSVIVVASTATTPSGSRTAWITKSDSDPVFDVTPSSWQASLYSTINSLGARPGIYLVPSIGANGYSINPVSGSYQLASYDQIVSDGGVHLTALPQFGGKVPFTAEGIIPTTLNFWAIHPSTDLPKPQSTLVGQFTFTSSGLLVFSVGTVAAPVINSITGSQTVAPSSSVALTADVAGVALFYQWQKNGTNVTDGGIISGATTATLNLTGVALADSGDYTLVVTNLFGGSVTSLVSTLSVKDPVIVVQPADLVLQTGSTATFSVTAAGTPPLRYQWRLKGAKIANATDSTFTLNNVQPASTGLLYSVVVSNNFGSVTSLTARVTTVGKSPSFTKQPLALTKTEGQIATFSAVAAGFAPLSYQWQFNSANITGATRSAYTNSTVQLSDAGSYALVVSNLFGVATSSVVALTVNADVKIPTVAIAAPTVNATLFTDTVLVHGSAADDARVSQVLVSLNGGTTNAANLTDSSPVAATWGLPLTLTPGTNTVTVQSVDFKGNKSLVAKRSFFFAVTTPVTINIVGKGSITPTNNLIVVSENVFTTNLYVGRSYFLTAVPGANYLFTNWVNETDSTTTNTAKYTFIVETNLTLTANFVTNRFLAVAGSYNGLFSDDVNGVALSSAGFANVIITAPSSKLATFSGKLLLDGNAVTFAGTFDLQGNGTLTKPIDRSKLGKEALTLQLHLPFDASNTLSGTVSPTNGDWTATLEADRAAFNNTNNPATNYLGSYTLVIPGSVDPAIAPGGDGYATVTIATNGAIVLSGALGEKTVLTQSIPLSQTGEWPLFSQLYLNTTNKEYQGAILGWLSVDATNGVSGLVHWIKQSSAPGILYTNGFTNDVSVIGSPYNPSNAALAWTSGLISLQGVDTQSAFTNGISFQATPPKFTVTQTNVLGTVKTLVLTPKTGLLTGTYKTNATAPVVTFKGVILQKQNEGRGFFPVTDETGAFLLKSAVE